MELYKCAISGPLKGSSLRPYKSYRFSFDFMTVTYDPQGAEVPSPYLYYGDEEISMNNSGWQRYEVIIDPAIPSTGKNYDLSIELSSSWGTNNVIRIDNLLIEEM